MAWYGWCDEGVWGMIQALIILVTILVMVLVVLTDPVEFDDEDDSEM